MLTPLSFISSLVVFCVAVSAAASPKSSDGVTIDSFDSVLATVLPEQHRDSMELLFYGRRRVPLQIKSEELRAANDNNFEILAESLIPDDPSWEPGRPVRIGVIQNSIATETTRPTREQYQAIETKVEKIIDTAGRMGVNILSLQEAWTMPFAFCTREKHPWTQFAEPANERGESTKFLSKKAKQWNMVIINPILERDIGA
eukprot:Selendium_serpulae@DN6467_c1_g1_i2.p1